MAVRRAVAPGQCTPGRLGLAGVIPLSQVILLRGSTGEWLTKEEGNAGREHPVGAFVLSTDSGVGHTVPSGPTTVKKRCSECPDGNAVHVATAVGKWRRGTTTC